MLLLLVGKTILFTSLCRLIFLFDVANAEIGFISDTKLVEKIIIDTVAPIVVEAGTSATQPDVAAVAGTEEGAGASPMQIDVAAAAAAAKPEEGAGASPMQIDAPVAAAVEESGGLCAADASAKVAFCRLFLRNEILFDWHFEEGTGTAECERREIVLTQFHQDNLREHDRMDTYECPRVAESALIAEMFAYYVSQAHATAPVIVYNQRNPHVHINPFKAVTDVVLAELADVVVPFLPKGYLLRPMHDLARNNNANQLAEDGQDSIDKRKLTSPYGKFVEFHRSYSVCGMTTNEKLFACKHYVFPAADPAAEQLEMEATVDLYEGSSAYNESTCRRRDVVMPDNPNVGPGFGKSVAQFRCPSMQRYELRQGTGGAPAHAKIRLDHTVRLLASHRRPSTAFLLDVRYHQTELKATVSGIENANLRAVQTLRRTSRRRRSVDEKRGSYAPARHRDGYAPIDDIVMSRDAAEVAVYEVIKNVAKPHVERLAQFHKKISIGNYQTRQQKVDLCNAVFNHQAFGYKIKDAVVRRNFPFEMYVNRFDYELGHSTKKRICISCEPETPTIFAELFVAAATDVGVIVFVRDSMTEGFMTPWAVAYPPDVLAKPQPAVTVTGPATATATVTGTGTGTGTGTAT